MFSKALLKSFSIVFFGSFAVSVLNYLFHLVTGRMLGPIVYGELVALIALITIFGVPFSAVGLSINKEVSRLKTLGKNNEISYLLNKYAKRFFLIGLGLIGLFILVSPFLAGFLHTTPVLIIIVSLSLIGYSVGAIVTSSLNGLQKFPQSMISGFLNASSKLIFAISAIFLGYGLIGSVLSFAIGGIIGIIISLWFLRKEIKEKQNKSKFSLKTNIVWIMVALVCFNALINLDLVLAQHFLTGTDAGLYAAASEIGKIIFFMVGSLSIVLIPKAMEQKTNKIDSRIFLFKTIALSFVIALIGLIGYFLLPHLVVSLLYGPKYVGIEGIILITGITMTFFSISSLLINYFIAVERKKFVLLMMFFIILEIILITLFHSSFEEVALMVLISNVIATITLILYLFFDSNKGKIGYTPLVLN
jgi:O-antigen/teichoic acid export membrane protein